MASLKTIGHQTADCRPTSQLPLDVNFHHRSFADEDPKSNINLGNFKTYIYVDTVSIYSDYELNMDMHFLSVLLQNCLTSPQKRKWGKYCIY